MRKHLFVLFFVCLSANVWAQQPNLQSIDLEALTIQVLQDPQAEVFIKKWLPNIEEVLLCHESDFGTKNNLLSQTVFDLKTKTVSHKDISLENIWKRNTISPTLLGAKSIVSELPLVADCRIKNPYLIIQSKMSIYKTGNDYVFGYFHGGCGGNTYQCKVGGTEYEYKTFIANYGFLYARLDYDAATQTYKPFIVENPYK